MSLRPRGDAVRRLRPHAPGADDCHGDDPWNGADVAGLGEGGEQNAPLGRAVIGGLMFATVTTLFVVPIIYSYLRTQASGRSREAIGQMDSGKRGRSDGNLYRNSRTKQDRLRRENQELRRQLQELRGRAMTGSGIRHARQDLASLRASRSGRFSCCVVRSSWCAFSRGYFRCRNARPDRGARRSEQEQALPRVEVVEVGRASERAMLELPGNIQAITEAPVLARADGYVIQRMVDIGDRVRAGQTVAEIEAPEMDEQVRQSKANLHQARAASGPGGRESTRQGKSDTELARVTAQRWASLAHKGVVSRQENDQYQASIGRRSLECESLEKAVGVQRSNVAAAEANVARLEKMQELSRGEGALQWSDYAPQCGLRRSGEHRQYAALPYCPDRHASYLRERAASAVPTPCMPGKQRASRFRICPGATFTGTVARTANSLDPASRTLLVEVHVPNERRSIAARHVCAGGTHQPPKRPAATHSKRCADRRGDGTQVAVVRRTTAFICRRSKPAAITATGWK